MADRFPSLEEFDSGVQADVQDPSAQPSADDFLAREKALLGDDADQFTTNQDTSDDLLGGTGDNAASTFESQFPDITAPAVPSVSYNSGFASAYVEEKDEDEPEVIKEWRERRGAAIAKRAEQFAIQREETVTEARQNIDDFYENYNTKKEKGINQSRREAEEFLAKREDTVSGGTSWDRIAKLVDVSGKGVKGGAAGSGKERFREMLLSLRKDEKAPGATGI
ncbi:related to clathrin light chain [Cephalotrichum gorgonifer]|uniref:Clathrin light chain n=1 Tax=Cephalotrichum gorgonifer TaxID=2041049 RepID=A0AAE8MSK9_9PEZI|nr:related to clathrin light chain [Cephalotrichum gorgonifer]